MVCEVGEHQDFPVENLSKSHCGRFLASCSHDQKIKFWNIEKIPNEKVKANDKTRKAGSKLLAKKDDFFSDLMEMEGAEGQNSDIDSSGDDEEESDLSDFNSDIENQSTENGIEGQSKDLNTDEDSENGDSEEVDSCDDDSDESEILENVNSSDSDSDS